MLYHNRPSILQSLEDCEIRIPFIDIPLCKECLIPVCVGDSAGDVVLDTYVVHGKPCEGRKSNKTMISVKQQNPLHFQLDQLIRGPTATSKFKKLDGWLEDARKGEKMAFGSQSSLYASLFHYVSYLGLHLLLLYHDLLDLRSEMV